MKSVIVGFMMLFAVVHANAQEQYILNANCRKAYQEILNLRFEAASRLLEVEASANAGNLLVPYLRHYILFLENVIAGDKILFERSGTAHTALYNKVSSGPKNSPWHLYTRAQLSLQWSLVRIREGSYANAAIDFNRAYRLLNENNELYPDFTPNQTGLALMKILIGSIPENYQWVSRLFALNGSVNEGIAALQRISATAEDVFLQQESLFLLTFTTFNLADNEEHTRYLESILEDPDIQKLVAQSPLLTYASVVFAMHNGRNNQAIDLLLHRPAGSEYYPFYYLDYLTGVAKLNRLDNDASVWFLRYLVNYKGETFVKSAYQRLAWAALVAGDKEKYAEFMSSVKARGNTRLEGDERAEQQAVVGNLPDIRLLKSTLLFDGGYYQRALSELQIYTSADFHSLRDKLEFTYRKARIFHEWDKVQKAIPLYISVLNQGESQTWYYAANAALNLGLIYENQKDFTTAEKYYRRCLGLNYTEYKTSISQKAKAGLNRVKGR